jgi:hypothetical protein
MTSRANCISSCSAAGSATPQSCEKSSNNFIKLGFRAVVQASARHTAVDQTSIRPKRAGLTFARQSQRRPEIVREVLVHIDRQQR